MTTWVIHFNPVMVTGLALLPGSFVVGILLMMALGRLELGALAIAGPVFYVLFAAGAILTLIGIGMAIG